MTNLADKKQAAKFALESLIAQCQREIRCLNSYEDRTCLVATYDLRRSFEIAIEVADALEDAFNEAQYAQEDAA